MYDPLLGLLLGSNMAWWLFGLVYGMVFIFFNIIWTWLFGEKNDVKAYLSDVVGIITWPFLLLGPISGFYIIIGNYGKTINEELANLGIKYSGLSLIVARDSIIFWLVVIISILLNIVVGYHQIKHGRGFTQKWVRKPIHIWIQTLIFNIPLTIMLFLTLVRLFDQWLVLSGFFKSDWIPNTFIKSDGFYGLKWAYQIILYLIPITLVISMSPAFMLLRESRNKYSRWYKLLMLAGFVILVIPTLVLVIEFDSLIDKIQTHYLGMYAQQSLINASNVQTIDLLLNQVLISNYYSILLKLPSSFPIPIWIIVILILRILLMIYDDYVKKPGDLLTVEQFSAKFIDSLYSLFGLDIQSKSG